MKPGKPFNFIVDILTGMNASCQRLRNYFGQVKQGVSYDNYLWSDKKKNNRGICLKRKKIDLDFVDVNI